MENKSDIETINSEEAKGLKKIINDSTEKLMTNLSSIFSATKFESNNIKSANIDLNENMDSMANQINTLLNIVNKLKIREIKTRQNPSENIDGINKVNEDYKKRIKTNCKALEEIYQNINNTLAELKKSEYYILSKTICDQ